MNTILLLTDFSNGALNAAHYTIALSQKLQCLHIILLNIAPAPDANANSPLIASGRANFVSDDIEEMTHLDKLFAEKSGPDTQVETIFREGDIAEVTNAICHEKLVDIVVMGISGKSELEKILIGSNAIKVLESIEKPLIVVPGDYGKPEFSNVVLTTDLDELKLETNANFIDKLVAKLQGKLSIVNIAKTAAQEKNIPLHLTETPDVYTIESSSVASGVLSFLKEHPASLVIVVHKKRGLLSNLFHTSVSKKLVWESGIPILVLPE